MHQSIHIHSILVHIDAVRILPRRLQCVLPCGHVHVPWMVGQEDSKETFILLRGLSWNPDLLRKRWLTRVARDFLLVFFFDMFLQCPFHAFTQAELVGRHHDTLASGVLVTNRNLWENCGIAQWPYGHPVFMPRCCCLLMSSHLLMAVDKSSCASISLVQFGSKQALLNLEFRVGTPWLESKILQSLYVWLRAN